MNTHDELQTTIAKLTAPGKGIVAADESTPTITKRFTAVGIESTEATRRAYRTLLFTTPGAEQYLAGVILYEETLGQADDKGTPLPDLLAHRGIVPGIKVDKGTVALPGADGDLVTQGLDGLADRLRAYKAQGRALCEVARGLRDHRPQSDAARHLGQRRSAGPLRGDLPERGHRSDRRARGADRRRAHARAVQRSLRRRVARGVRRAAPASGAPRRHRAEAQHGAARQGEARPRLHPRSSPARRSTFSRATSRRRCRRSTSCPAARRRSKRPPISMP